MHQVVGVLGAWSARACVFTNPLRLPNGSVCRLAVKQVQVHPTGFVDPADPYAGTKVRQASREGCRKLLGEGDPSACVDAPVLPSPCLSHSESLLHIPPALSS